MTRKIYALLLALLVALGASFSASAQFRFAGVAGGNITDLKFKQDLVGVGQMGGFQAGVTGELMFPGIGLGMDIGLLYNMANAHVNLGDRPIWASQGYGREHLMLHQLNIPLHLRFKYTRLGGLEYIIAPFVYGGPDFTITLGHNKCEAMEWAGGDIGLTAGGGVELWRRWQLSVQYTWGMSYVVRTRLLSDFNARTRIWSVRLSYYF